jgi:hypothetical protein
MFESGRKFPQILNAGTEVSDQLDATAAINLSIIIITGAGVAQAV